MAESACHFLAAWASKIPGGRVYDHPVSAADVAAPHPTQRAGGWNRGSGISLIQQKPARSLDRTGFRDEEAEFV
jgi:hypothetical protein